MLTGCNNFSFSNKCSYTQINDSQSTVLQESVNIVIPLIRPTWLFCSIANGQLQNESIPVVKTDSARFRVRLRCHFHAPPPPPLLGINPNSNLFPSEKKSLF